MKNIIYFSLPNLIFYPVRLELFDPHWKRKVGPRTHVWSEPEVVDAAAAKLNDTEELLKTAEELSGPYIWGVYDVLVLPPSFAYRAL